jgi:hypothetical protein
MRPGNVLRISGVLGVDDQGPACRQVLYCTVSQNSMSSTFNVREIYQNVPNVYMKIGRC